MKSAVLVGIGAGSYGGITDDARTAIEAAAVVVGASRVVSSVSDLIHGHSFYEYNPERILEIFDSYCESSTKSGKNPHVKICAALFSGDTGFYSGATKLYSLLVEKGWSVKIFPGISCVQYFASRLGTVWQDWHLVSAHGISCNLGAHLRAGRKTCFITGGDITALSIMEFLSSRGLNDIEVSIGVRLSYLDEQIYTGKVSDALGFAKKNMTSELAVVLVDMSVLNAEYGSAALPDEVFVRSEGEPLVPMTKQIVRASVMSLLSLRDDEVFWDVGAGTGAVSVDAARCAACSVYSVEDKAEAILLEEKNRAKFCVLNMEIVRGHAPEALVDLPAPDAVFVGGSEGHLSDIIRTAYNSHAKANKENALRVVVAAVTTETLVECMEISKELEGVTCEVTQVSVASTKLLGRHHLLRAENPVFLISLS